MHEIPASVYASHQTNAREKGRDKHLKHSILIIQEMVYVYSDVSFSFHRHYAYAYMHKEMHAFHIVHYCWLWHTFVCMCIAVHIEHTLRSIQLHSFCYHFKVDFFWCDDLTCIQPIENFKLLMLIHVIQCASNRYEFWLFKNVSGKNKMRRERGGKKIVFNILECNIIFTATTCSTVIVWFYRVPRP